MNVLIPQLSWGDWKKTWRVCENKSLLCYSKNGVASQTTQTQEASMDKTVYHIANGNASTILYLFRNIGRRYCMER